MSHLDVVETIEYDDLIFVQQPANLRLEVAPQLLLLLGVRQYRVPASRPEVLRLIYHSDDFPLFLLLKKVGKVGTLENYIENFSRHILGDPDLKLTSRNSRNRLVVVVFPLLGIPVITTRGISYVWLSYGISNMSSIAGTRLQSFL